MYFKQIRNIDLIKEYIVFTDVKSISICKRNILTVQL